MKSTLVLCTHNRPIESLTWQALRVLEAAGARLIDHLQAPSDVTLARCLGLSSVCRALRDYPGRFDVVLMVDDDMVFTLQQALSVVEHARRHSVPTSACYATQDGKLAAMPCPAVENRWLVGLGFLAVPSADLLALETKSERWEFGTGFTSSGAHLGRYWSEDYTLCSRLGGVVLLPLGVGHIKQVTIYPDFSTLTQVADTYIVAPVKTR